MTEEITTVGRTHNDIRRISKDKQENVITSSKSTYLSTNLCTNTLGNSKMKKKLEIKCPKCHSTELHYVEVKVFFKNYYYHACKKCGYIKNLKDLKQELSSR